MLNSLIIRDEVERPTTGEILMNSGKLDTFLTDQLPRILMDAYRNGMQIVAIDGRPGIGKTSVANRVKKVFEGQGISIAMVSTDDDVKPRDERDGLSIMDFHPGRIVKKALRRRLYDSIDPLEFDELIYRTASGKIDMPHHYKIPGQGGVLIVEGLRSIEYALKIGARKGGDLHAVLPIYLDAPSYVVNGRRFARDVMQKGLPIGEVQQRIDTQESTLAGYGNDIIRELTAITTNVQRNTAHIVFRAKD